MSEPTRRFKRVEIGEASLLGAPLSSGPALDSTLESRNANLRRAVDRLSTLTSHDALTLLRSSFSAPRLMHILRCSPCHDHPLLLVFDEIQRIGINVITNSNLSDTQWIQASLPICDGGLKIRRAASLTLPAFLASAATTASLQHHILAPSTVQPDTAFEAAKAAWSNIFNHPQPVNTVSQRAWDAAGKEKEKQSVWDAASLVQDKDCVLAATAIHSGDWLHALPISA